MSPEAVPSKLTVWPVFTVLGVAVKDAVGGGVGAGRKMCEISAAVERAAIERDLIQIARAEQAPRRFAT